MIQEAESNDEVSEFSFDFAEIFPHVSELIFSHLSGSDLKECSLVSREWHKLIGTKPELMAKIKVKLDINSEPEAKEVLSNSSRKYQNIEIFYSYIDQFHVKFFKESEGHWKSVVLKYCRFEYEVTLIKITKSIEPTIEELDIGGNSIVSNTRLRFYRTLSFKNLKTLKIVEDVIPMSIFTRCEILTCFDVKKVYVAQNDVVIRQILQGNSELKNVKIEESSLGSIFDDNLLRNVTFKLDELYVFSIWAPPPSMANFLETQIESLTSLSINIEMNQNCFQVIFGMRKLKKLCIRLSRGWFLQWNELGLPQNSSIERFEFRVDHVDIIKPFVQALPNIKHLKIGNLTDEIFTFLSTNVPNLESLDCEYFKVSPELVMVGDPFPNLKVLMAKFYNYNEIKVFRTIMDSPICTLLRDAFNKLCKSSSSKLAMLK